MYVWDDGVQRPPSPPHASLYRCRFWAAHAAKEVCSWRFDEITERSGSNDVKLRKSAATLQPPLLGAGEPAEQAVRICV